ncbi:MAG: hypothetical protein QM771_11315 [Nitrospira sp.]
MEAADRLVAGNPALDPGRSLVGLVLDQSETVAVGTGEGQPLLAETFGVGDIAHALVGEALFPIRQSAFRHREHRRANFAHAMPAHADVGEREIGHHRTRRADLVGIIEMVDVRRIEIDGLLHPAQAELLGEELIVAACIARHRGDVVQPLDLIEHDIAPSLFLCGPRRCPRQYEDRRAGGKAGKHRMDCVIKVNDCSKYVHQSITDIGLQRL